MKKFTMFAQTVLVGAGFVLIFGPHSQFPSYYKPIPMGFIAIGYSFLIMVPAWLFRPSRERNWFQAALAIDLLLCGLGSLGTWSTHIAGFIPYDKFVHFTFSSTMMLAGTALLARTLYWSLKKTAVVVGSIIALSGVAWEFIEYFSASYFHFGYFGALFDHDSRFDLVANICGIACGLAVISILNRRQQLYNK